jgi:hypothetical protein
MRTLLFPLLSNRTVSFLWKCIKLIVVQQYQSRYYSNASTVTIALLWKCNMVHRSCYQGKPNMSQYWLSFKLLHSYLIFVLLDYVFTLLFLFTWHVSYSPVDGRMLDQWNVYVCMYVCSQGSLFMRIYFLNYTIVIVEQFAKFTTNKTFSKTYTLLNFFHSYHTSRDETSFFDHCASLELRYLNSRNITDLKQVRSRTFRAKDLLLYYIPISVLVFHLVLTPPSPLMVEAGSVSEILDTNSILTCLHCIQSPQKLQIIIT